MFTDDQYHIDYVTRPISREQYIDVIDRFATDCTINFCCYWAVPNILKHTEDNFSPIQTDLLAYKSLRCLDFPNWQFFVQSLCQLQQDN